MWKRRCLSVRYICRCISIAVVVERVEKRVGLILPHVQVLCSSIHHLFPRLFHRYPAHRLILATGSEVFRVMLLSSSWQDSRQPEIELEERVECLPFFPDFLKYFYTGKFFRCFPECGALSWPWLALSGIKKNFECHYDQL